MLFTRRLVALLAATAALVSCTDDPTSGGAGANGGAGGDGAAGAAGPGTGPASGGQGGVGAAGAAGGAGGGPTTGGGGTGGAMTNGFPPMWPSGEACGAEDPIFVWEFAPDTFILRQSLCTSFEGPFLYLLFGEDKVILEDTGDGGIPVQQVVQSIIDQWLVDNGKESIELVVVHSHGHGDHVSGDGQFQGQPNTTVVATGANAVIDFFDIQGWPSETISYDLGGRSVDIIPIPGHQSAHIAIYDPKYELLLTGDTLYPGRLYIQNFGEYVQSVQRLVSFTQTHPVSLVLGTHIEMTNTPGQDFDFGADVHPNERELELTLSHLTELEAAVVAMGNSPQLEVHDDFIVYPL